MSPRVFVADYQFLACGDVFTQGLAHAAHELGLNYQHAEARNPNLARTVAAFRPDLLFVVHGRMATPKLASLLPGLNSAIWLLDEPYEVDDTSRFSAHYGHTFVCDRATLHRHHAVDVSARLLRPAGAYARCRAHGRIRSGFIGGANATRDRFLAALARAGHLSYVVGGRLGQPRGASALPVAEHSPRADGGATTSRPGSS